MSRRSQSPRKGRGTGALSRLLASLLSVCLVLGTAPLAYAEDLSGDGAETAAEATVTEEMESDLSVVEEEPADEASEPIASETTDGEVDDDTEPVVDAAETEQGAPAVKEGPVEGELLATAEAQGDPETPMRGTSVPAPDGYTEGPNGLLAYGVDGVDQTIDVMRLFDNRWISSTNSVYFPLVRIGDDIFYAAEEIFWGTGLVVTAQPSFTEDGRGVFVRYSIEYSGVPELALRGGARADDTIEFDFAIAGDVQVCCDDNASIILMDSGRGFYMISTVPIDVDDNGVPASFVVFFSNTAGVDEPTAVWIGSTDPGADLFSDQRVNAEGVNSAFAISWQSLSLARGEKLVRGFAIAVDELAEEVVPEPEPDPVPVPEPEPEKTPQRASSRTELPATGDDAQSAALPAMLGLAVLLMGGTLAIRRRETGC